MAADKSKIRMNLSAIKKVDPYAKDIVDSSSHVAFYTFNSEQNEWEKTDVEGAFFIYSRNAQPFYSIFINNRLNTNSFVEPVTAQLELQSQPPFLLYRNERSRIRGFWFYNSQECDRIGNLVIALVQKQQTSVSRIAAVSKPPMIETAAAETSAASTGVAENVNIFKMLSKAQQEYNNLQTAISSQQNVLNFFASAKPTTAEVPFFQRGVLPNTLSVDQLEKQQRVKTPQEETLPPAVTQLSSNCIQKPPPPECSSGVLGDFPSFCPNLKPTLAVTEASSPTTSSSLVLSFGTAQLAKSLGAVHLRAMNKSPIAEQKEKCLRQVLIGEPPSSSSIQHSVHFAHNNNNESSSSKPALMPPTMFDSRPTNEMTSTGGVNIFLPGTAANTSRPEPLSQTQLVQAFSYLMQNDDDFVHKLHQAYLKTFGKTSLVDTYQ